MCTKQPLFVLMLWFTSLLVGCAGTNTIVEDTNEYYETPALDYVQNIDISSSDYKDSFLNQLAMNYRSYAIYNAEVGGFYDIAELFAQKSLSAFSGEMPIPEMLDSWTVEDEESEYELELAYKDLMQQFEEDIVEYQPKLAAEAQAKFDCWLSASASGQFATAEECKARFQNTLEALIDCKNGVSIDTRHSIDKKNTKNTLEVTENYYPETRRLAAMGNTTHAREGIIIVNNVVTPIPVPQRPIVFTQNITGMEEYVDAEGDEQQHVVKSESTFGEEEGEQQHVIKSKSTLGEEYVSRAEFINMMNAMRSELAAINSRLDNLPAKFGEDKTIIKVQQIPLEPKQRIMEEIFEVRFDFDKSTIKPEYEEMIRKLSTATQNNKNIKVSIVGHTDTVGSSAYNYALGGRRAEAVQKMLIAYGIPSSQIIAVSSGEEDLKVKTPDNTPNEDNRRVRVVKEVTFEEPVKAAPVVVEEYSIAEEGCEKKN